MTEGKMDLNKWSAEKVMGWHEDNYAPWGSSGYGPSWVQEDGAQISQGSWEPLTNMNQAMMVVEKMRGKGFAFEFENGGDNAEYHAVFLAGNSLGISDHDNPAEAILTAAHRAVVKHPITGEKNTLMPTVMKCLNCGEAYVGDWCLQCHGRTASRHFRELLLNRGWVQKCLASNLKK